MRILFYTCVHDRYESFNAFLVNCVHIRKWIDIEVLVTITQGDNFAAKMCKNELIYEYPNKPIGKKWNAGLRHSRNLEWDFIFITGSDDLYSPALIEYYHKLAGQGYHYIGLLDFYFYSTGRNMIKYYPGHSKDRKGEPQGAGRMIHRNVLEALDWTLWDDNINIALDASMTQRFENLGIRKRFISIKELGFVAIDIKDGENIHDIKEYKGSWVSEVRRDTLLKAVGL